MGYLERSTMGRDPKKKRLDLQLTPEEIKLLAEHATSQRRSTKNMAEVILSQYIEQLKKEKKKK